MSELKNPNGRCVSIISDAKCYPLLFSTLKNIDQNLMELDLTQMQHELEYLLVSLNKSNRRTYGGNYFNEKKNGLEIAGTSHSFEDKSCSKMKFEKVQKLNSTRVKSKKVQPVKTQDSQGYMDTHDVPKASKNDSCSRFWSYLEPYCAEITSTDVKMLNTWIESYSKIEEYQYTPPLGEYYASKWLMDDILDENREGAKSIEDLKGSNIANIVCLKENETLKQFQKENSDYIPPLLEQLISNLVEENLMTSPNDVMTDCITECKELTINSTKSLSDHSDDNLENRMQKAFKEIGVMEEDPDNEVTKDELVVELHRLQTLLIPVSNLCLLMKKRMLSLAKEEIHRQESQKRVNEINAKVMENYREMLSAKSKNKNLKKKERYQIRNLLQERDNLIKNLCT